MATDSAYNYKSSLAVETLGRAMRIHHLVIISLCCTPLPGRSQTAHELREWELMEAAAMERLPEVVHAYAESIGCNVSFNPKNTARWHGNPGVKYIALIAIDEACSGGSGSWRSILLAVREGANARLLIHPDYSLPRLTSQAFPQMIDSISAAKSGVRFTGRVVQAHDDHNNPSRPISGTIAWSGREWIPQE